VARVLFDAEVRRLEQFRQQDHLCAFTCGAPHQCFRPVKVRIQIPAAGHLRGGNRHEPRLQTQVRRLRRGALLSHSGIITR
jgi:hypothetical protein